MKPIISLGCAFWDTILRVDSLPKAGGKKLALDAVQAASGMATAAAVTIHRLGGAVDLWTRIGDDSNAEAYLADLAAEGLATDHVRRVAGARTWISTILIDGCGDCLVVPFADRALDPDPGFLPLERVAGAGAVMADMRWPEGAVALFTEARRVGVPSILDADVAPVDLLERMIPLAGHVLFSEAALMSLGRGPDPERALSTIAAQLDAEVVGVTLGSRGALVAERRDGRAIRHVSPLPVVARDTLNAGDVWHGTYAYGLVAGWSVIERVRRANVAAAIKCERFGGRRGAPTLAEIMARAGA